jgi:hypothetical protein
MSVEVYSGQVYTRITKEDIPAILSEAAALLAAHTSAAVVSTEDNRVDGEGTFRILIHGGGGRYFCLQYVYPETYGSVEVSVARGYLEGGAFVASQSVSDHHIGNGADSYTKGASLTVVNGGAVWDLKIKLGRYYAPSLNNPSFHLRCAELASDPGGAKLYAGGVFYCEGDDASPAFPGVDYTVLGGTEYALGWTDPTDAVYSVPAGKLLLFPSLLTLEVQNDMGAATVGGKLPYFMAGQAAVPLGAYTEFLVDRTRYVSLGHLAIRST